LIKRFLALTLAAMVFLLALAACTQKLTFEEQLIQKIQAANVSFDEIYHYEIIGNYMLIFYRKGQFLNEGVLLYTNKQWKWLGGNGNVEMKSSESISYGLAGKQDTPYNVMFGAVCDTRVASIKINEEYAKIISKDNFKIWFLISTNELLAKDIKGISSDNQIIYSIGQ